MPEGRQVTTIEIDGVLATTSTDQFVAPFAMDLTGFTAVVGTAPGTSAVILDLEVNGTDLFTGADRLTIAPGATEGTTTAKPAVTRLAKGDNLVVKVAQVGAVGAEGSNLDLSVEYVAV